MKKLITLLGLFAFYSSYTQAAATKVEELSGKALLKYLQDENDDLDDASDEILEKGLDFFLREDVIIYLYQVARDTCFWWTDAISEVISADQFAQFVRVVESNYGIKNKYPRETKEHQMAMLWNQINYESDGKTLKKGQKETYQTATERLFLRKEALKRLLIKGDLSALL